MAFVYEDLPHQRAAIDAVCDLFRGQETEQGGFTVTLPTAQGLLPGVAENSVGVGNRSVLPNEVLLKNLQAVQMRNRIPQDTAWRSAEFDVEMETGTGKTYVYLSTIFELHQRYGFTKFVIVVPSVAIKEGVAATLRDTREHFFAKYNRRLRYFVFDSNCAISQVIGFARDAELTVMLTTVGSINKKDVNRLYKVTEQAEQADGERPIDFIQLTRPVLIVDEPQRVDGGVNGQGREALARMSPLCTLRYSATHATQHHVVYRLDPIDAYDQRLVKQIEVASLEQEGAYNRPYVRLIKVEAQRGKLPSAFLEVHKEFAGGVVRPETVRVFDGDDLNSRHMSGGRAVYAGMSVGTIRKKMKGLAGSADAVELNVPGSVEMLTVDRPEYGGVSDQVWQKQIIRQTVEEHFRKEVKLKPQGIKVLSLFFLERVADYRVYGESGVERGKLADWFEEAFVLAACQPAFREKLFAGRSDDELREEARRAHDGYFANDNRLHTPFEEHALRGTKERQENETFDLIMRDKARLLDQATPLRFIWSHSALREGWDNPNVFQVCAFREMREEGERRQTIGRGLRLCVDADGRRVRGFEVNTLTVIAGESFQSFAENLQKDMEADTHLRFGVVAKDAFATVLRREADGTQTPLGSLSSRMLWESLRDEGYLQADGKVCPELKRALDAGTVVLPSRFEMERAEIEAVLRKRASGLVVRDSKDRRTVKLRGDKLDSPEFKALWERIRTKSTYRVKFDPEELVRESVAAVRQIQVDPPVLTSARTILRQTVGGLLQGEVERSTPVRINEDRAPMPDVMSELQARTGLLRKTLARVLIESQRFEELARNPGEFVRAAAERILGAKQKCLVDGIQYVELPGQVYAQELFRNEELTGYVSNLVKSERSLFEEVICDSDTEKRFAVDLNSYKDVKLYVKLPGWFTIPTPLGTYNPDWALLIEKDDVERLYCVVDTKSSLHDMRFRETVNVKCGEQHFKAIAKGDDSARFEVALNVAQLMRESVRE